MEVDHKEEVSQIRLFPAFIYKHKLRRSKIPVESGALFLLLLFLQRNELSSIKSIGCYTPA